MIFKIKLYNNIFLKTGAVLILVFIMCSCRKNQISLVEEEEEIMIQENSNPATDIFSKYEIPEEIITNIDIVPDEKTAEEVAEVILISIYGKNSIKGKKPFKVDFDSEYNAWVVSGTLKPNMLGGVPTIIIQKSDGKVLAVSHSK